MICNPPPGFIISILASDIIKGLLAWSLIFTMVLSAGNVWVNKVYPVPQEIIAEGGR